MIEILRASEKDNLDKEWNQINIPHYGRQIKWIEKHFRFKAVKNGKIIGIVDGKFESGIVFIDTLITAKKYRAQGVGTLLLNKAEKYGKRHGAHRTWLVTGKEWPEKAFYEKLGFVHIGDLPDFYFHVDFVIYTRTIT